MKKLVIRQFGGSDIAELRQDDAGRLRLDVFVPELEEEMRALINRLSTGTLTLRTGERVKTARGHAHQTVVRKVPPGDPDFLKALSDALARERVGGRRVRGVLTEE
jgi:hypothetical protein